ncbi:hypothetical protein [Gordonia sp. (in: high G+C Gram-positive bacteria)]|uniref:hypothetical protein n=1 Tax=Gordonia sp. (in: high G+C Gram-positive bacteria) TaxID=84139 RepID=UPI003C788C05
MSSPGSAQPPVDYYAALGLDTRAPHHALLAQLAHRIAQTAPGPERHLMEQARAVLGDSEKKSIYDQRLRDPQAPPWTPAELHELAMAQPSRPTASAGITVKLAAIPRRVLAAVAAGLALVLVLVVTLVSCTGGGSNTTDVGSNKGASSPAASSSQGCTIERSNSVTLAAWNGGAKPDYVLVLTEAYPLPASVGSELSQMAGATSSGQAIQELANGDIEVKISDYNYRSPENREFGMAPASTGFGYRAAYLNPEGELLYTYEFKDPAIDVPVFEYEGRENPYDSYERLRNGSSYGVFRITAKDGIGIPAKAANSKNDGKYALDVLVSSNPNGSDGEIWLLLRGGTDLYKAKLVETSGGVDPTSCV